MEYKPNMNRFLLLLAAVVVCQQRTMGKPLSGSSPAEQFQNSASTPAGLGSLPHLAVREVEGPNSADQASLCYFVQESEVESQISCKLRFTRSKFNFNPFGLRFGKRNRNIVANDRSAIPSELLLYLLYLKETGLAP
ncbi:kisspeptin 2 isoform X2 [Lepisosteus oculatus]|uniref:kisspeptin 2 isoform X2 n=1 Tax=Lepisosteus oculatus TaxID=7918 RepID=UPI0007403F02|nr:PREDICTED: uncharacterized protein LOC107077970 isoform X2 [Lepisosteus oculatus]